MSIARLVLLVLIPFHLSAQATADEVAEERRLNDLALDRMLEGQGRVMRIADRMRVGGEGLCGKKVAPVIGVYAATHRGFSDLYEAVYGDKDYIETFIEAAVRRFELGRLPKALVVVPDLPADRAGLESGDVISTIGGDEVKKRVYLNSLRKHARDGVVPLSVDRNGEPQDLLVEAQMGCTIPSRYRFGTSINAFAASYGDLTGIYINDGLLRFLPHDDDLAVIVGHELAHLVLSHTGHLRTSDRYEAEADYLGLYLAALAGYDISGAPGVFDALAKSNPYGSIDQGYYSHPRSAKRSTELEAVVGEITAQQTKGLVLRPKRGSRLLERPEIDEKEFQVREAALRDEALKGLRSDQERTVAVSYRLSIAGAPVCGEETSPVLGAIVGRRQDFILNRKDQAEAAFGVGDDVAVFAVAEGSPAEEAGLRPGDRVLAVNGSKIKRTKHVFDRLRKSHSGPLALRIRREADVLELPLPRKEGCDHGTSVVVSGSIDTHTHDNKKEMLVPIGLLRFVEDDDELAIAVSHQIGHQVIGSFRRAGDEPRADELGLRIAALAGYDVSKAPAYWDRVASAQFWKISRDMDGSYVTHGAMSIRAPAIRRVVDALKRPAP